MVEKIITSYKQVYLIEQKTNSHFQEDPMQETPQQYQRRILSYTADTNPMKILQTSIKKIQRLVKSLSKKQLMKRPQPDKWSIGEIMAHLAETEIAFGYRYRMVLSSNGIRIQAFDQNKWAENANYRRQDPKKSLELWRSLREGNIRLLKGVPKEKSNYYGIHEERGKESLITMVKLEAGHDINHLMQIEKIKNSLKKKKIQK